MSKKFTLEVDSRFNYNFEDDEDDFVDVSDAELQEFEKNGTIRFVENEQDRTRQYLINFFNRKQMHFGGPILLNNLLREENLELVNGLDLPNSIDLAFAMLGDNSKILEVAEGWEETETEDHAQEQREKILTILNQCCSLGIPKSLAGGILLLYLEFCCGHEIP